MSEETFTAVRNAAVRKQISLCLRLQALKSGIDKELEQEMQNLAFLMAEPESSLPFSEELRNRTSGKSS